MYDHTVVEAYDSEKGVMYSNLEERTFNYYGLFNGIDYKIKEELRCEKKWVALHCV